MSIALVLAEQGSDECECLTRLYSEIMMTTRQIADVFGCNPQTVANRLKRYGIPLREGGTPAGTKISPSVLASRRTLDGKCLCGCGETPPLAERSRSSVGEVVGIPRPFVPGHGIRARRKSQVDYVVEDRGHATPCWIWQRGMNDLGYGSSKDGWAHRTSYEEHKGLIPAGMVLDHLCRIPPCINPEHLEPVTQTENIRRGKSAKLTKQQVFEILASGKTNAALGHEYGVHRQYISHIRNGWRWKDVVEEYRNGILQ